jgi:hypothetical protein
MLGEFNKMLNKLFLLKEKVQEINEKLKAKVITAKVGAGLVVIKMNGKQEVVDVEIDESLLDKKERKLLESLIKVGVNEAMKKSIQEVEKIMFEWIKKEGGG